MGGREGRSGRGGVAEAVGYDAAETHACNESDAEQGEASCACVNTRDNALLVHGARHAILALTPAAGFDTQSDGSVPTSCKGEQVLHGLPCLAEGVVAHVDTRARRLSSKTDLLLLLLLRVQSSLAGTPCQAFTQACGCCSSRRPQCVCVWAHHS